MEEVIQREKDLVYRLAFSQCHQKDQADDIFQNVMYRYLKGKPTFESLEHEKAWFIRVTLNCSKTSLKSFWNNKVEEIDEQAYIFEKKEIDLTPYLNFLKNIMRFFIYFIMKDIQLKKWQNSYILKKTMFVFCLIEQEIN